VTTTVSYLYNDGCQSTELVPITACGGSCGTFSTYSLEAQMVQHSCSCCQEKATTKKEVPMICSDGRTFNHSYIYIEECGCVQTECTADEASSASRSLKSAGKQ
ncbi:intestinal mucin-like protein, partial [Arapaima gigas]